LNIVLNWKTNDAELRETKIKERKMRLDLLDMAIELIKAEEIDYISSMKQSHSITKCLSGLTDKLMNSNHPSPELEMIKNMNP
tara:strand:- start:2173 stop:2421 length:249 start_codon:yes stop_codon:yes gene_type:complete